MSSSKPRHKPGKKSQGPQGRKIKVTGQPQVSTNPLLLEQFKAILSIFHDAFSHLFTPSLPSLIQDVKQSLYQRDYVAAFSSVEKLQAYAARWSVTRALAYFEMLSEGRWSTDVKKLLSEGGGDINITCIGGGAGAELVAIAAAYAYSTPSIMASADQSASDGSTEALHRRKLQLNLLDFASWAPITDSLYETITKEDGQSPMRLQKSELIVDCHQQDILSPLSGRTIASMASADIITLLFTAGELYSQSPSSTTKLFMTLHALTKPGAILVVVDSAGGFEELDVLKRDDTQGETAAFSGYKLGFLLDKTLTNKENWEILVSEDSKWWRLPQELREGKVYPLTLENMRCLIRAYRRSDD